MEREIRQCVVWACERDAGFGWLVDEMEVRVLAMGFGGTFGVMLRVIDSIEYSDVATLLLEACY